MFSFIVIGPAKNAMYLVAYKTPGCEIFTPVMECSSEDAAIHECARLNYRERKTAEDQYFAEIERKKKGGLI